MHRRRNPIRLPRIYGGVAAAGEWALQNGCAVAYTDKGAGIGIHDIEANVAYLINGQSADADALGNAAHFRISPEARADALRTGLRHRLAFKHAHAQTHPESNWGRHVLLAIQFAFFVLNVKYDRFRMGKPFMRGNVTVIASGISNGGGASLRAVEQDAMGWIDGFVVGEPAIQPRDDPRIKIKDRGNEVAERGLPILDYMSFLAVYQPAVADAASTTSAGEEWRKRLAERGLLSGETDDERRKSAQEKIRSYGILKDQEVLQKSHSNLLVPLSISVTYANAYGRFALDEFVCGYSFARTDHEGNPIPLTDPHSPLYPHLFSNGNGVPPYIFYPLLPPEVAAAAAPSGETTRTSTAKAAAPREIRISIVYGGKAADRMDVAPAVSAALRLRRVVTGNDDETGEPLATEDQRQHERIAKGIQQVRASGYLHGKPGIIVHGRSDGVIAVNHTSRAYVALNQLVEGGRSKLRYVEVTNTQHFDAFNASVFFPELSDLNPLHPYLVQALSWMREHLAGKKELPPSQVVVTTVRPQGIQPGPDGSYDRQHMPPITAEPGGQKIKFVQETLIIP